MTVYTPGAGCSKLTISLVKVLLKFQILISEIHQCFLLKKCERHVLFSHFFSTQNISENGYKVAIHLMSCHRDDLRIQRITFFFFTEIFGNKNYKI